MNYNEFRTAVIAAAEQAGLRDYELYYSATESDSVSAFQHEINECSSSVEGGVCFRCLFDGRMGYASTEALQETEAAGLVRRAMENARSLETEEQEYLGEGGEYAELPSQDRPLPGMAELKELVLRGQDALYAADPLVVDGSESQAEAVRTSIAISNSRGLDLSYTCSMTAFISEAVVSDGTEMNNSYEILVGGAEAPDVEAAAKKAVADAKRMLGAGVAPTGAAPVVFGPRAMASLLSTFSTLFSAETARKGLSRYLGQEGQKIAAETVTLVDDPFYPRSAMPMPFDAEGSPTAKKEIITAGELKTLLHNLKTAAALGKKTTGNAAKSGYAAPVEIRPFTLVLQPGTLTEEELLQKADGGVLIEELGGLHAGANPISGDFSLQSSGYLIENGARGRAVRSFTVAGNFYELLKNIVAMSDEARCRPSGGATNFACPYVLTAGLSIAGE